MCLSAVSLLKSPQPLPHCLHWARPFTLVSAMLPFSFSKSMHKYTFRTCFKIVHSIIRALFQHEPPVGPLENDHLPYNTMNKGCIKFFVLTSQEYPCISMCVHIHVFINIYHIDITHIYSYIYMHLLALVYIYRNYI